MKIVSSTFGQGGSVFISNNRFYVESSKSASYSSKEITKAFFESQSESSFGAIGFIVGFVLLSVILLPFLGVFGVLVAAAVAFFGSKYTTKKEVATVNFTDGNHVKFYCTARFAKKIAAL